MSVAIPTAPWYTQALIDCVGFPDQQVERIVLQKHGYPASVALIFADALDRCTAQGDHPGRLLWHLLGALNEDQTAPTADSLATTGCHYRYLLRLVSPKSQRLSIACWRRYPGGLGWQRRCGPMTLQHFLARFLDTAALSQGEAKALGASS